MKRFTLVAIALLVVAMGFAIGEKILTYKKSDKTPLKKQQITKTKLTREGTSPINVEGTLNMTVAAGETEVIDTLTITSETVTAVDIAIQGAGYLLAVYTPENEGGEENNEGGEENNEGGEDNNEGGEENNEGGEGAGEGGEDNNEGGEDNNEGGEENNEGGEGTEEGSGEGTEEGAKSGETSWVASLENVALPAKILVKYTVSAEKQILLLLSLLQVLLKDKKNQLQQL